MSFRPPHLERYPLRPLAFVIVGDWPIPAKSNLVGGHEGAGIVVAVGSSVQGIEIGDHVGTKVSSPLYGINSSGCTIRVGNVSIVWMTRKHIVLTLKSQDILSTVHFSNTPSVNPTTSFKYPNPSIWPPQPQLSAPEQPHTEYSTSMNKVDAGPPRILRQTQSMGRHPRRRRRTRPPSHPTRQIPRSQSPRHRHRPRKSPPLKVPRRRHLARLPCHLWGRGNRGSQAHDGRWSTCVYCVGRSCCSVPECDEDGEDEGD